MATPTPTPSTDPSSGILQNLITPGAIAGIAISVAIAIIILAVLCWCCCCRHSSKGSLGRQSSISRLNSETPTSELGFVHEPASMLEMDATGRGVVLEEPPPAYYTLEHRHPLAASVPVEMGAETRRGAAPEVRTGMEAWNGGQVVSETSAGMNPRGIPSELPVAGPAMGRNRNLRVDTDVTPVIHVTDENGEEDEDEALSRSITYSTYSVREAAVGTVAMPSVVKRTGDQGQGKS